MFVWCGRYDFGVGSVNLAPNPWAMTENNLASCPWLIWGEPYSPKSSNKMCCSPAIPPCRIWPKPRP